MTAAPPDRLSAQILAEAARADVSLRPQIRETPLIPSAWLGREEGTSVLLKLETHQIGGSFKFRGALNRLVGLSTDERARGVVAASTGNHGIAVAEAGGILGVPVTVFVPDSAASSKLEEMSQRGATLVRIAGDPINAEKQARRHAEEEGQTYVSPYNDASVVAGQATIGLELARQCSTPPAAIFVPLGGGGLAAGIAIAAKSAWASMKVVACSPVNSAVMARSIEAGRIVEMPFLPTLSDGTAGGVEEGSITFDLCRTWIDEFVTVTEDEIRTAMRRTIEEDGVELEGAAAVAVAGYLKAASRLARSHPAVVVLSGANVARETLAAVLSS
jgi:threonine dehydratase